MFKTRGCEVRLAAALGLFALALLCGACVNETAPDSPSKDPEGEPLSIPDADLQRPNPIPADAESIARGERLFTSTCTGCHGASGDGTGELAQHLEVAPPDLTSPEHQRGRTDGELFFILTNGHDAMPAQGERWTDELKWDVVNYIRSLQDEE